MVGPNRVDNYILSCDVKTSFAVFELMKHVNTSYPCVSVIKYKNSDSKQPSWNRDNFVPSSECPRCVTLRNAKLLDVSAAANTSSYGWGGTRDEVNYTVYFEASVMAFHEPYSSKDLDSFGEVQIVNLNLGRNISDFVMGNSLVVSARKNIKKIVAWGGKLRFTYDILPAQMRYTVKLLHLTRRFRPEHPISKFDLNLLELLLWYIFGYGNNPVYAFKVVPRNKFGSSLDDGGGGGGGGGVLGGFGGGGYGGGGYGGGGGVNNDNNNLNNNAINLINNNSNNTNNNDNDNNNGFWCGEGNNNYNNNNDNNDNDDKNNDANDDNS
jgi:hypothetical protein